MAEAGDLVGVDPFTLAESKAEDFDGDAEAVERYVVSAVGSTIDGVPVRHLSKAGHLSRDIRTRAA